MNGLVLYHNINTPKSEKLQIFQTQFGTILNFISPEIYKRVKGTLDTASEVVQSQIENVNQFI